MQRTKARGLVVCLRRHMVQSYSRSSRRPAVSRTCCSPWSLWTWAWHERERERGKRRGVIDGLNVNGSLMSIVHDRTSNKATFLIKGPTTRDCKPERVLFPPSRLRCGQPVSQAGGKRENMAWHATWSVDFLFFFLFFILPFPSLIVSLLLHTLSL